MALYCAKYTIRWSNARSGRLAWLTRFIPILRAHTGRLKILNSLQREYWTAGGLVHGHVRVNKIACLAGSFDRACRMRFDINFDSGFSAPDIAGRTELGHTQVIYLSFYPFPIELPAYTSLVLIILYRSAPSGRQDVLWQSYRRASKRSSNRCSVFGKAIAIIINKREQWGLMAKRQNGEGWHVHIAKYSRVKLLYWTFHIHPCTMSIVECSCMKQTTAL